MRRWATVGAAALVAALIAIVFLGRGSGSDDSGEPRFLRFVANDQLTAFRPFVRVERDGRPVAIDAITLQRLSTTRSELCVVVDPPSSARHGAYTVQIVAAPQKRFGKSFPSDAVVRDRRGDFLAQTLGARRSPCRP